MGSKSSAQNYTSTTTTTVHDTDSNQTSMAGDGAFVQGDGNIIHSSDAEVLKHLGTNSMDLIGGIGGGVLDIADKTFKAATDLGAAAVGLGNNSFDLANDTNREMSYLATGLGGMAAGLGNNAFDLANDTNREMSYLAGDSNRNMSNLASDSNRNMSNLASDMGFGAFGLADNVSNGLMQLANNSNRSAEESTKNAMALVNNYTERSQLGMAGAENSAMKMVAIAAVGVVGLVILRGK